MNKIKNSLIIVANPNESSFSFAIANKYKEVVLENHNKVELVDLYKDKQQSFFPYNDSHEVKTTDEVKYYQEKISKADELIFVFPYWWGGMPAILKNFFDWNLSSGYAFKYENSRPVGLLKGKTVKVFTTTGYPKWYYTLNGANGRLKKMFKNNIIEFCGMKLEEFNIFGGVDTSSKNMSKILEKIK